MESFCGYDSCSEAVCKRHLESAEVMEVDINALDRASSSNEKMAFSDFGDKEPGLDNGEPDPELELYEFGMERTL